MEVLAVVVGRTRERVTLSLLAVDPPPSCDWWWRGTAAAASSAGWWRSGRSSSSAASAAGLIGKSCGAGECGVRCSVVTGARVVAFGSEHRLVLYTILLLQFYSYSFPNGGVASMVFTADRDYMGREV